MRNDEAGGDGLVVSMVFPSGHFFNTPCVPNLAKELGRRGFQVAVYLASNSAAPSGFLHEPNVTLRTFPVRINSAREPVSMLTIGFVAWLLPRFAMRRSIWMAVGVRGLFVVGILAWIFRRSFIYNSLEIYASPKFEKGLPRMFKRLEAAMNRRALFTIIQDERRAALQRSVNSLGRHKFVVFPNAPLVEDESQPTSRTMPVSHRALEAAEQGAATGMRILSYSGSIAEWGGFSGLPLIAAALPKDWLIIVQSRMRIDQDHQVSLDDRRLVVSTEPLSVGDYHRFVRMSDVGLAWYEPSDPNLRFVGLSSGKIAQYWALGKPIIVNRLPLYEEIFERFRCGILVDRPDEIPAALARIAADLPSYQQGARDVFRMYFDIESHGAEVARELRTACSVTPRQ